MFDVRPIISKKTYDCGAICMQMLLDYYGIEVDIEDLLKECNITIGGCTGKDLLTCGRKHGLDMTAWKEIDAKEDITESAKVIDVDIFDQDRPAIIWWKYNHFCIYCGVNDEGKVVICNPSRGRYSMSKSLFNAYYSKVSICNGEPQRAE